MDWTVFLGITAGILHLIAFAFYNKQMLRGTSRPNTATWTLWAFIIVLNSSSYMIMSGDWVKSTLSIAGAFACIFTLLFSLFKGKLSKLDLSDGLALAVGLASGFVWWYYKSATYANLVLQLSVIISFIPTYRGVWNDPRKEEPLPWYIWSTAYLLNIIVVVLRWNDQYQDLVFPVLCFLLHAPVGLLTYRKPQVELKLFSQR